MINKYIGTLETGQPFVAMHTLIPREQRHVGLVVGALNSKYDSKPVEPSEFGWTVSPLARDVTLQSVELILGASGDEIIYMGKVTIVQMDNVLGAGGTKKAFATQPVHQPTVENRELH